MKKKIIKFLESIVHHYYTKDELNKLIDDAFGVDIDIEWDNYTDGGYTDYDAMFNVDDGVLYGYYDIYWLPCKPNNDYGYEIYVTEIGYEFL